MITPTKRKLLPVFVALLLAGSASVAWALTSEVQNLDVAGFTDGQTLTHGDLNTRFEAIVAAMKALDATVDELEETTSGLSGGALSPLSVRYSIGTGGGFGDSGQNPTQLNESVNGYNRVDFASVGWDPHATVTTGTSWRFTAPEAGVYQVTVGLRCNPWSTGEVSMLVRLVTDNQPDLKIARSYLEAGSHILNGTQFVSLSTDETLWVEAGNRGTDAAGCAPGSWIHILRVH